MTKKLKNNLFSKKLKIKLFVKKSETKNKKAKKKKIKN